MTELEKVIDDLGRVRACGQTMLDCGTETPMVFEMIRDAADNAISMLNAQRPRVMTLEELTFYDSGLYVETHNGCPEGLTDELWPALVHLYCVSQNGEYGYVSFVNWNADTYDLEAKDYNVDWRCWTSRPTDEQREAEPWSKS